VGAAPVPVKAATFSATLGPMYREPRLVVLDGDAARRTALAARLSALVEGAPVPIEAHASVPDLATLEADDGLLLVVGEELAGEVIGELAASRVADVGVVVVGKDGAEAAKLLEAGALDVWRWPLQELEIPARVRSLLRIAAANATLAEKQKDARSMVELTQTLASSLDISEILYTVTRRIAAAVRVERVSIVLRPSAESSSVGYVVAASDDQGITNLRIDLEKYPELLEVFRTRSPLTIHDPATHPLLEGVRHGVPSGARGTASLFPILWHDEVMGAVFVRSPRGRSDLSERERSFCQIVANATAVALRNARILQTLRDETEQVRDARREAEQRLHGLKRYADLFASSADGLAAFDPRGKLLFANPRAYEIVGATEAEVQQAGLLAFLPSSEHAPLAEAWQRIRSGDFPRELDVRIAGRGGSRERIVCASFSALQESEGAVLVSFRDVTEARQMAGELRRTRDFLEGLIQATVDAIIAADRQGNVLLFNHGAERIYGWKADEVVGKRRVTELYPPGGAQEVMRLLRSEGHGGPGRLEQIRFEAMTRDGVRVPIHLSAAVLTEDGVAIGTVGIFTDIREKLRVEERLAQATEKLAISEKQAIVAELAGTTAHELNQPLTSILGYTELLRRKLVAAAAARGASAEGSAELHGLAVIAREAERMADIVKKIGKITKYETKSYVGGAKILDLDRASGDEAKGGSS
jgi:PAS domain S-box-containing protein